MLVLGTARTSRPQTSGVSYYKGKRMTSKLLTLYFIIISIQLLCCSSKENINKTVESYSFNLSVPIHKCTMCKSYNEIEKVNFELKIINEDNTNLAGLLNIKTSKNSKWRYITGQFVTKDSLVLKDSLAILDTYFNVPAAETTRLTGAEYHIKIFNDSLHGEISIVPTELDTAFDRFIIPEKSTFKGALINDDTLSAMEKNAWTLFEKEKHLKASFDSIQNKYNTFDLEYKELPDSVYNSLGKIAFEILKTSVPFFEKYQHSDDSSMVQNDFMSRIYNAVRLSSKNDKDLQSINDYLMEIQPEGSRFYLTWNQIVNDARCSLEWADFKLQKDPEYSGRRFTKDEIRSKMLSRSQAFFMDVDPILLHPSEELEYFYMYSHRVVQHNIGYQDTLLKLMNRAQKARAHDEEYIYHINRIKGVIENYVSLSKRLGNPAPNFIVKDISGKTINLSSYRNKVVYLDFWTTWCGPCIGSIPNLKSLYDTYKNKGLEIIGIAPDDYNDVLRICNENKITWPQIVPNENNGSELTSVYGVSGYPKGFLIDKKGIVVEIIHPNDERLDFIVQQYLVK
jgi:thiol-disulfide isomerase/thioredoxin